MSLNKCVDAQSLCGHSSPVESLVFDSMELSVLAGASTGAIKLWDLEETKSKSLISAWKSCHELH